MPYNINCTPQVTNFDTSHVINYRLFILIQNPTCQFINRIGGVAKSKFSFF